MKKAPTLPIAPALWLRAFGLWLACQALVALGPVGNEPGQLAYIDPAASSFVVQAVLGLLAAAAVVVRTYWSRIKTFLGIETEEEPTPSDPDA